MPQMEKFVMFHLLAYDESYTSAAENDLTPVQDNVMAIQNGHFFPQTQMQILWAAAMGVTITRARIITPTLNQVSTPYIRPIEQFATPGSLPGVADYRGNPINLQALEEIQVNTVQASGGTERECVLLGVTQQTNLSVPSGSIFSIRGTSTTPAVAFSWTGLAMTWQNVLPNGTYACVGLEVMGVGCNAGRLQFQGQLWNPGCPGSDLIGNKSSSIFTKGGLGVYGSFAGYAMPIVQVLANAATAVWEVYMDLIRTA
jgi:hypothetical protein